MIQKSSLFKVLEVFFKEPTNLHFIREISREIDLAATSTKNNLNQLLKEGLIVEKKSKPFNGYVANRENEDFLFYKRTYNLFSLNKLKKILIEELHPRAIVLFGSYSRGEDIESSDIDLFILSKVKKPIKLESLEKELNRKINIMILEDINKLEENILKKIYNGIVLSGEI